MKLVVCCLVAVAYCVVVCAERDDRDRIEKKRHEVFNRIIKLNKTLKVSQSISSFFLVFSDVKFQHHSLTCYFSRLAEKQLDPSHSPLFGSRSK